MSVELFAEIEGDYEDIEPPESDYAIDEGEISPAYIDPDALVCRECGKALIYGGRGRKPKYCDEHKKSRGGASKPRGVASGSDAAIAAEVLTQVNNLIAITLMSPLVKLPVTGEALSDASEGFKPKAQAALAQSPALAKAIARAGGISGSAALVLAYGQLAMMITPIATMEMGGRRETRSESV